jgi:hypothetical protein
MRPLIALAIVLSCSDAVACDLSLVSPARSDPVHVTTALADDVLRARFAVSSPALNGKKVLGKGQYPYDFDVVELFVTFSDTGFPYFEFEVSPYNQTFQVRVVGKKEHHEGADLGLTSTAAISRDGWTAELKIPLKPLGWDGDASKIRGNLYSVLGPAKSRSYWSAFLPKAAKAIFTSRNISRRCRNVASVAISKFVAFCGAAFRTSESKGRQQTYRSSMGLVQKAA